MSSHDIVNCDSTQVTHYHRTQCHVIIGHRWQHHMIHYHITQIICQWHFITRHWWQTHMTCQIMSSQDNDDTSSQSHQYDTVDTSSHDTDDIIISHIITWYRWHITTMTQWHVITGQWCNYTEATNWCMSVPLGGQFWTWLQWLGQPTGQLPSLITTIMTSPLV